MPRFFESLKVLGLQSVAGATGSAERLTGEFKASVETLIAARLAARLAARRAKNFAESDRIRDELATMGIALKDGKDPATGEPTTSWEVKRS